MGKSKKLTNSRIAELYSDYIEDGYSNYESSKLSKHNAKRRKLIKKETSKARRKLDEEDLDY